MDLYLTNQCILFKKASAEEPPPGASPARPGRCAQPRWPSPRPARRAAREGVLVVFLCRKQGKFTKQGELKFVCLVDWLVGCFCFVGCLFACLFVWLVGWLLVCLFACLIVCLFD